jgi:hypothetical protein
MTYEKLSHPPVLVVLTSTALGLFSLGCGDSSASGAGSGGGGNIILDAGQGGVCISVGAPAEQPDLISGPTFAVDQIRPGDPIEGDIVVDGETRTVTVEAANYWKLDEPPVGTETVQTGGNQTLSFSFPTGPDTLGRFFFRITLCAADCDARRVVFTVVDHPDIPNARNDVYQRIVFEGDTEVSSQSTCLEPDSIAVQ